MLKAKLILLAIKIVCVIIALGLGVWYMSSTIGGASITYTSLDNFMTAIGTENGNIATAGGCFMCEYVADLFAVIGDATEKFWTLMVDHIWILMLLGFGLYMAISITQHILNTTKEAIKMEAKEAKIETKALIDKLVKQGIRVLVVGALMGMLGLGGTTALKVVSRVTITPVMFVGAEFSMAATGVTDAAKCYAPSRQDDGETDILNPIMQPFMCVIGNINTVMLAGASGGFALMNYAWMGMGGGAFTWIAGLALVLMFMIIGFDLFFQILTVVFKLVFLIIFLPLLLAATAFEGVWAKANNLMTNAVGMLVSAAVKIVAITLKVLVIYATVSYTADMYFPGPVDGYSAMLPQLMGMQPDNIDDRAESIMNVFSTCERVALVDGEMDKDKFKQCFTAQRAEVERKHPGAFDFMDDGWDFLLMMVCLFCLYYFAINDKIDKLLIKDSKESFDYGTQIKELIKTTARAPIKLSEQIAATVGKKE